MATNQITVAVRSFASSAKKVKLPTQVFGIEGRYASALYSAATQMKQLDSVEKDLSAIKKQMAGDSKLRELVMSPVIKRQQKVDALKQVSTKMNLSAASSNLLGLLAENGRLNKFDLISNAFSTIMAAHRGDLKCEVTTAKTLDDATKKELQTVLQSFAKKGENILLELKVDSSLIGGMIVSIGDKYVDMSTASKIKKYTEVIKAAI